MRVHDGVHTVAEVEQEQPQQFVIVMGKPSVDFGGYWQRHVKVA
jgi:hypothetical protein